VADGAVTVASTTVVMGCSKCAWLVAAPTAAAAAAPHHDAEHVDRIMRHSNSAAVEPRLVARLSRERLLKVKWLPKETKLRRLLAALLTKLRRLLRRVVTMRSGGGGGCGCKGCCNKRGGLGTLVPPLFPLMLRLWSNGGDRNAADSLSRVGDDATDGGGVGE
jgi:hypothetical protein